MIFRPLLSAAGKLYEFGSNIRNLFYERGIFRSVDLGRRTISIGNITAGGTGKTPLTAATAKILAGNGEKVCILTRGYGRNEPGSRILVSDGKNVLADAKTGGDEPVELANKLLGKAIVVADADRVSAARWARENFDISVFILDDGFQHRRAKRDLDIVLIDATDPFGDGMIPAGTLREPKTNLKRADAVILTRSDLVNSIDDLIVEIRRSNANTPIFTSANSLVDLKDLKSGETLLELQQKVFAFCGIGNPHNFFELLKRNGSEPIARRIFRDHHIYTREDIDDLLKEAKKTAADLFITTAKDAVKLAEFLPIDMRILIVEIEPNIEPFEEFRKLIIGTV